jgi:hypothetical protein
LPGSHTTDCASRAVHLSSGSGHLFPSQGKWRITYNVIHGDCLTLGQYVVGRKIVDRWWTHGDAFIGCNEGRTSELSRRVTCMVLFTREGRPGMWLMLVAALWAVVAATAFGTPG